VQGAAGHQFKAGRGAGPEVFGPGQEDAAAQLGGDRGEGVARVPVVDGGLVEGLLLAIAPDQLQSVRLLRQQVGIARAAVQIVLVGQEGVQVARAGPLDPAAVAGAEGLGIVQLVGDVQGRIGAEIVL
jgi:hypothetical protein